MGEEARKPRSIRSIDSKRGLHEIARDQGGHTVGAH
jgi:hypothetical protein